jgi:hypothetical protein
MKSASEDRLSELPVKTSTHQRDTVKTSDTVAFPEAEPWVVGVCLVVPLIHGIKVGRLQGPAIRQGPETLQPFDLGDGSIDVHSSSRMHAPGCRAMPGHPRFMEAV